MKTLTINGKEVTFRKLTMGDLCALSAVLHTRNTALLTQRLSALYNASGIEDGKLPIIAAELSREPSFSETWRWLFTLEGMRQALARIANTTPQDVDLWEDALDRGEIVSDALGVRRGKAAGGERPLSQASGAGAAT